jgi:hypothetical protein
MITAKCRFYYIIESIGMADEKDILGIGFAYAVFLC